MNIKYSKKKEELRKDPFIDFIAEAQEYVRGNANRIITGVVVIALLFGGVQLAGYMRRMSAQKSQEAFGKAMLLYNQNERSKARDAFQKVITEHRSSSQAAYSSFILGHIFLEDGKIDEAIDYFEKAHQYGSRKAGFVSGEALEGLAACYEVRGEREKALDYFNQALDDEVIAYRIPAIRWKMALLHKKLGNKETVVTLCNELVADTLALEYRKQAENLLAAL